MSAMKQFGLEFVVRDQATKTLRNLNNEISKLERNMNSLVPIATKFEKTMGNLNTTKAVNQVNRLNGAMRNYNTTLKQVGKNNGIMPQSGGGGGSTGGGSSSSSKSDWMSADYFRDMAGQVSNSLGSAFSSMPFGSIISSGFSSSMDGIITGIMTGNVIPALSGVLTGGLDMAMGIYNTSSQMVHSAIYSAFEKGTQLVTSVITKYLPQTFEREYDIQKLSAVLGDDKLANSLSKMGVEYAKASSLSLSDMDYILPNLVMANKATGVVNEDMYKILQKQMDAVVRLNFKDSGQGAGVKGSLVALQEMLSGDYISLKRRFEMTGASIERIQSAESSGGVMAQMEQLIKELEMMGVTDEAIAKMGGTAKFKFERIGETITDIFTNPSTGIFASLLEGMKPLLDNVDNFLNSGGGILTGFNMETGAKETVTQLELITANVGNVISKLGEFGLKLVEGFVNGFVATVDWGALSEAIFNLMDSVATYFEPAFNSLGEWVNTSFIPWLGRMNGYLQDETIRQGIMDYIESLKEIMDNSLILIETITVNMPTIASTVTAVSDFVTGVLTAVGQINGFLDDLGSKVKNNYKTGPDYIGNPNNSNTVIKKPSGVGNLNGFAKGTPFVPEDNYPALLHRGERVLTAQQNRQYENGGVQGVTVNVSNLTVREEADIKKIARAFVTELNDTRLTYGGAY